MAVGRPWPWGWHGSWELESLSMPPVPGILSHPSVRTLSIRTISALLSFHKAQPLSTNSTLLVSLLSCGTNFLPTKKRTGPVQNPNDTYSLEDRVSVWTILRERKRKHFSAHFCISFFSFPLVTNCISLHLQGQGAVRGSLSLAGWPCYLKMEK